MNKKRLSGLIAFLFALAISAAAQPSLCTISGTLYDSTGTACSNCKILISKARQGSTPLNSPPIEKRSDGSGAVSFTAVQGSFITITGTFSIGRYNFASGLEMYVPLQSTATLITLQTAEDALNSLISTTSYAPADAGFITKTASSSLSNEFALGSLATGILKNTTTTGVPSIATAADLPLISTLTADGSPDGAADYVLTYDASAGAHKKVLLNNLPGGGGGGAVSSVFGRTGAVVAALNDYTFAQIDKTTSSLADLTTRSASDLTSGTLPDARFPSTLPAASGVNLTALNASNLGSGTVPLARLSGITTAELSATAGITNGQLAGSIANGKLANSGFTLGSTSINLGDTATTIAGLTLTTPTIASFNNANHSHADSTGGGQLTTGALTGLGTGIATALGVNVGSAGAPVLFNGAGGTPSSLNLSNATALPVGSVTGLGTGVATALAVNVGSAGAFVTFNGALGTPSSATLTNATGLPVASGISGLGAGVATFLATPSSANLAAAVTDETGTGALVFANSPALTTPNLGTPSALTLTNATGLPPTTGIVGWPANAAGALTNDGSGNLSWAAGGGSGDVVGPSSSLDNELPRFDSTTGKLIQASGVTLSDLSSNAYTVLASSPTQGASATIGSGFNFTASPAIAGNTNAGAAAGGAVTITAGAAARLTSGNANGGNIVLTRGAGIGTGAVGQVLLAGGDGSTSAPAIANNGDTDTGIYFPGTNQLGFATNGTAAMTLSGTIMGLTSALAVRWNSDVQLARPSQAATLQIAGNSSTAAGTFSTPALTPTQLTADQNNYAPGTGWFQSWSSDASRTVTGLAAGVVGQIAEVWNDGSNNIVFANESASSTAANRFSTSTAADLTLVPGKCAQLRYNATASRWRVYLCN